MKNVFVIGVGIMAMSVAAYAQDRPQRMQLDPEQRAERRVEILKEQLELPDEKWEQVMDIKQDWYAEMKASRQSHDERLKAVLNEEEYARLQEAQRAEFRRHARHAKRGGERYGQMEPRERAEQLSSRLKSRLELPEEKWDQLTAVNAEFFAEKKALRTQRAARPDKEQLKALQENRDEKLQSLLNEEEYASLKEAQHAMRTKSHERWNKKGQRENGEDRGERRGRGKRSGRR